MGNLGFPELLVIMVLILLVFGAKRLPEIGASFGKGIREFKKSINEATDNVNNIDQSSSTPSRQLDAKNGPNAPTGGEPKRLSQ